jgi:hypothetical protein
VNKHMSSINISYMSCQNLTQTFFNLFAHSILIWKNLWLNWKFFKFLIYKGFEICTMPMPFKILKKNFAHEKKTLVIWSSLHFLKPKEQLYICLLKNCLMKWLVDGSFSSVACSIVVHTYSTRYEKEQDTRREKQNNQLFM